MNFLKKIVIENSNFALTLNENCIAESLVYKPLGKECIVQEETMPFFSLTEGRPYNNEIKLAHPNKRTTFQANRVRREGDRLIVGFELVLFEAIVKLDITDTYIAFMLEDFIVPEEAFGRRKMSPPPVWEFRLIQLPIYNRKNFGEWLNVSWDDDVAINVLATSPYPRIDSEKRRNFRILTADAVKGIKLKGTSSALIVSSPDKLLDAIETVENDYDLPNGVKSRRSNYINTSIYWSEKVTPDNIDEHIAYAKKGGFRLFLIYYYTIFKEEPGYKYCGDYDLNDNWRDFETVKKALDKIKEAGLVPGIHWLHSHIGTLSRYVTPVADPRLNHTQRFTLAKPLSLTDDTVYVEENPNECVMHPDCRVLQFDGELIHYTAYTTEYPYAFTGCTRGHFNTIVTEHNKGIVGGIIDLSEYGATSIYADQNTNLQDEVGEKLARLYNEAGFEFVYFDGSEGTNPPFEFHIPNAQYRVYKKLDKEPIFCEGAAKAHFSWHMLSGGNAFDVFPTDTFKKMIAKHPLEEAGRMAEDFTRVNFGWWIFRDDTQPDIYEYGTSRAASWDCPITMQEDREAFANNARTDDILEVMRRWEEVRKLDILTKEQKLSLRNPDQEHTLLINEKGEYELVPYYEITSPDGMTAFIFERNSKTYVTLWHKTGSAKLTLDLPTDVVYEDDIGKGRVEVEKREKGIIIPISKKRYLSTTLPREEVIKAFENAKLI